LADAGPRGAGKEAGGKGAADLQRIEARKSVVVQSSDGQTATGDWANFDTKRNMVTLGGDVVLTQGQNVVRGSRLTIDMTTGQSVIETDPATSWSARARPAGEAAAKAPAIDLPLAAGGRPSAVFYPKSLKGKAAPGAQPPVQANQPPAQANQPPARAKSGSAWTPSTEPARERQN
jgi:lipopolysaccharide export system protein LptA